MTNQTLADHLLWLSHLQPQHRHIVGEDVYHLGMALQKGCPIVPGVVVSAVFFDHFLESVEWADPLFADLPHSSLHIDVNNPRQLQAIAQRIQQLVSSHTMAPDDHTALFTALQTFESPAIIIRPLLVPRASLVSQATSLTRPLPSLASSDLPHSLLVSRTCRNTSTDLMTAIRQVWTSFFQANHLFYWQRLNVPFRYLQLAMLIQPAVPSIAAGTIHITKECVDICAHWGLLQGVKTGDAIPDRYRTYANTDVTHQYLGSKRYAYALHTPPPLHQDALYRDPVLSPASPQTDSLPATAALSPSSVSHQSSTYPPMGDCWLRHPIPDQYGQQRVLSDELLGHIQRLSHNLYTLTGMPLRLEWSLHPSSSFAAGDNTLPPWYNPTSQTVWSEAELLQLLEQQRASLVVTQLFLQDQKDSMATHPVAYFPIGRAPAPEPSAMGQPETIQPSPLQTAIAPNPSVIPTPDSNAPMDSVLPNPGDLLDRSPYWVGVGASGGQVTAPVWVVTDIGQLTGHDPLANQIIVTQHITFSWFNAIRTAKGLISDRGGITSHGAILAREVGIPAVVGVNGVMTHLKTGDWVVLDGDRGTITPIPPPPDATISRISSTAVVDVPSIPNLNPDLEPITPATQLMLSLSQTDALATLAQLPVDGVGLIRSELMIAPMLEHQPLHDWLHPDHRPQLLQTIAASIQQFAQAFAPRPIWYRTLDMRSHEYPCTATAPAAEPNPLLGYHGTLSYQLDPTLFLTELNALKQVQINGYNNVNILLPFVRTVEEFQFCHQAIQQIGLLDSPNFQVWIMAEVPSAIFLLPDYFAAGVQGIAIGSNDLAHLLLALDRTTAASQAISFAHPSVLAAIKTLITTARQANIPCSLCGELASQHPDLIESFVRWGITTLSVGPDAVITTRQKILQAEWRLFQEWQRDRLRKGGWDD